MSLTTEQYLALSALAYEKLSVSDSSPDANKISNLIDYNSKPELRALSSSSNWTLIAFEPNTPSGFAAVLKSSPKLDLCLSLD